MFRFKYFLFLLLLGISCGFTFANSPNRITTKGITYQVFYGNEQFLSDFNKTFQEKGTNSGIIKLPEYHAYSGINLPFLEGAEKLQGKVISKVELAYTITDRETKLRLVNYQIPQALAQDCCTPPASWPEIKTESYDDKGIFLLAYEDFSVSQNDNTSFEYSPYGGWPNDIVNLERNQSKEIEFFLFKGSGGWFFNPTNRDLCSAVLSISKGLERPKTYSMEGTPTENNWGIMFKHQLKFSEAGIYQVRFDTELPNRTNCDGNIFNSNPTVNSSVIVYVCVKFPEGRPPTPTNAPVVAENGYYCGKTKIQTTIPAIDYSSDLEYYWSTSTSRPTRDNKAWVEFNGGTPLISGNVFTSGYWRLYAYAPCADTWSLAGAAPDSKIEIQKADRPSIRTIKRTLCEGETTILKAVADPNGTVWWYKRKDPDSPAEYLKFGSQIEVSEAGIYVAKLARSYSESGLFCTSKFSNEIKIEVVASPQPQFSLDTDRVLIEEPISSYVSNEYIIFDSQYEEYNSQWEFTLDWGDGMKEPLTPSVRRIGGSKEVNVLKLSFDPIEHIYKQASDYTVTFTIKNKNGCIASAIQYIKVYRPLCSTTLPLNAQLTFKKNKYTGQFAFENDCYSSTALGCISDQPAPEVLSLAVQATAHTLSDTWPYPVHVDGGEGNAYETGEKGNWRIAKSYAFKSRLIPSDLNTTAGRFNHIYFDWETKFDGRGTNWVKTSTIQLYEPNGQAVQEENPLGIKSAAKYGYHDAVPYLISQNAPYQAVFFESFESEYESNGKKMYEEGFIPDPSHAARSTKGTAHAGDFSLKLIGRSLNLPAFQLHHFADKGFSLRFWVQAPPHLDFETLDYYLKVVLFAKDKNGNSLDTNLSFHGLEEKIIARTGKWVLFEKKFSGVSYISRGGGSGEEAQNNMEEVILLPQIHYTGQDNIWIDDIKVQPLDAQLTTFVYDPHTLRLVATFDDQHFGLYHQYDEEGRLVRKMIETERGTRTLQEKHVNIPRTEPRPANN